MMSIRHKSKARWPCNGAILLALLAMVPITSQGGEYVLERGNEEAVCTQFGKNLLALEVDPRRLNNVCPIPIAEGFSDLQAPEWISGRVTPMPSPPGVNVEAKIDRYRWERNANPAQYVPVTEWSTWTGTPQQLRTALSRFRERREVYPGVLTAYASIDIDNDGTLETVYRDNHDCLSSSVGTTFQVMTRDLSDIDRAKTERISAHPRRPAGSPYFRPLYPGEKSLPRGGRYLDFTLVEDLSLSTNYGAFIYRGKVFVTVIGLLSGADPVAEKRLHVYLHDQQGDKEVCTFRFDE
jgi:hypothetical protein